MLAAKFASSPTPSTGILAAPLVGSFASLRANVGHFVASGSLKVPMLPQVATEVLQAVGDPSCDTSRLSTLIHKDAALAARVLKIANSPLYLAKSPLVSLQQAVARLGFTTLTEIALAASVESGVFRVPGLEDEIERLWRESLATAAFAKEIARLRRLNVETAFLCGLLADIGRPVTLQAAVDEAKKMKFVTRDPKVRVDLISVASEYADAATKVVVGKWELPPAVRAAVANREAPAEAGPHVKEAAIAGCARALAFAMLYPQPKGTLPELHEYSGFALLSLYRDDVDTLVSKSDVVKKAVSGLAG